MEFSYRISEEEYLNADSPLRISKFSTVKTVVFWLFILVCLMVLITWVQRSSQRMPVVQQPTVRDVGSNNHVWDYISGLVIVLPVVSLVLRPKLLRRRYRKDPAMQGQFTVSVTPESIIVQNSVGTFCRSGWESFFGWYEAKGVMVLFSRRPFARILISLAGLSDSQCGELRNILLTVFPKNRGAIHAS